MTSIDTGIFKAYDIRGIYPTQLDGEVARRVGRAFVDYLGARRIAVGRDVRVSSPEIAGSFVAGARGPGVRRHGHRGGEHGHALLLRGAPRPRRRRHHHGLPQSPRVERDQDGTQGRARPLRRRRDQGDQGVGRGRALRGAKPPPGGGRAGLDPRRVRAALLVVRRPRRGSPLARRPRSGQRDGGLAAKALFDRLPVETIPMYFDLDGTFPNHPPDPLEEANRREIMERVAAEKADLGIAWDGDADRCFFIDDTGAFVPGDFVTALLGEAFCRKVPGARIVYDVRASRAVADRVAAAGGTALMHRVGHAFIKKRMRDENAVFGGEVSGHFYFRENWYADNGMIPALLVLELLGREKRKLSEILAPLRARYHISGEINSKVRDVDAALKHLAERYRDGRLTRLDGLSVDYDDWHFNVRPSNTEPLLRLNLEAATAADMEARRDEVLAVIRA